MPRDNHSARLSALRAFTCVSLSVLAFACNQDKELSAEATPSNNSRRHSSDNEAVAYQSIGAIDALGQSSKDTDTDEIRGNGDSVPAASTNSKPASSNNDSESEANNSANPTVPTPTPTPTPAPTPAPAPSTTPPVEVSLPVIADGVYLIQGVGSKRCLDIPDGRTDDNLQFQIWDCNQVSANQRMTIEWVGDGYYRVSTSFGRAVEGPASGVEDPSKLHQFSRQDRTRQQFSLRAAGDSFRLIMRESELMWYVSEGKTANGTLVQLTSYKAESAQRWYLKRCDAKTCK